MKELILIKFGGSIITDKNKEFTARESVIRRLGSELSSASREASLQIILVHGSGSFAHRPAAKYRTSEGIIDENSVIGFPFVADAAAQINRIVVKNLVEIGLLAVSFSPLSIFTAKNGRLSRSFLDPINQACNLGMIPTLYGDVIMDSKKGFCIFSAEKTIGALSKKLKGNYGKIRIIFCGDTNGVYNQDKETISVITTKNFPKYKMMITGSGAVDVTGGMIHKIKESLYLADKFGIETVIINGNTPGELEKAILDRSVLGTTVKKG